MLKNELLFLEDNKVYDTFQNIILEETKDEYEVKIDDRVSIYY